MASPVPESVHVVGFNPTSYGVWGILLVQLVVLTGYIIKRGPEYIASWVAAKKAAADMEQTDEDRRTVREDALNDRFDKLEEKVRKLNTALSFLMNAAITATNALEKAAPGDVAIAQSRELIGMAASALGSEDPFSRSLAKLATVKGVGEK